MAQQVVAKATGSLRVNDSTDNLATIAIPGTTVAGDTVLVVVTNAVNGKTITPPTGWALDYNADVGTGTRAVFHRKLVAGDTWIGSGKTIACTWSVTGNIFSYAVVVLDGTVYSGLGTFGTFTTRASSQTSTAAATGSTANPNLYIFHEKSTSQVSLTPSAGTVLVQQLPNSGEAGTVLVGTYDDSTATSTITALSSAAANVNGGGVQVPVTKAVVHTAPTVNFTTTGTDTTIVFTDTSTLFDSATIASQTWDFGDNSGIVTTSNPTHRYMRAGTYTVTHTVTDSQSANGTKTTTVVVTGITGDYWDGSAWHALKVTKWDGTTEAAPKQMETALNVGQTWTQIKANGKTLYGAHRGGSVDYVEMTTHAYWASATLWPTNFLEISVQADADGVFWCQHDAYFDRMVLGVTGGTTLPVASAHAATIQTYTQTPAFTNTPNTPFEPVAKLTDVLATFGGKRVIFIERKGGSTDTALLNILDANGGPDWYVWKRDYNNGPQMGSETRVSIDGTSNIPGGKYDTWGYFFAGSDMTNYGTYQQLANYVGLDYALADADLATAVATAGASRVIGHIIPTATAATRMLATGMRGLMVSGLREVLPMIHIGEHTLEQILEQHQRATRNQCLCGVQLHNGLIQHLIDAIKDAQQD